MSDLLARHRAALGLDAPLFYDEPLHIVRGEGVSLFDVNGDRYLDLYNNVPCVGHANPRVVEAIASQAGTLNVHSRYLNDGVVELAERLAELHGDGLESTVFTCSGTEANEVAVMAARAATGNEGVIVTDATYHGNLADIKRMTRLPVGDVRGQIRSFSVPDTFRPTGDPLGEIARAIEQFHADRVGVAALMVCPIFANEGLPIPYDGVLTEACDMVRAAGGLVVADEVQAGHARTGDWWGYEKVGISPDIAVMGKPMGNGVPVAATISSHDIISRFRTTHRYFNTFAASPLQAAAASVVLDEIEERDLRSSVSAVGSRVRSEVTQIDDPRIGQVRGHGLFVGIDWVHPGTTDPDPGGAKAMVEALKERRMLIGTDGRHNSVLKIRPPLVFGHDNADEFLDAFRDALT